MVSAFIAITNRLRNEIETIMDFSNFIMKRAKAIEGAVGGLFCVLFLEQRSEKELMTQSQVGN